MNLTHPSAWTVRRTIEALVMGLLIALATLMAPTDHRLHPRAKPAPAPLTSVRARRPAARAPARS